MKRYACPACGAEVIFRSSVGVYGVCTYCNSMIVRRDVDVESIGIQATLPEDMSPLQLGTQGTYRKEHFTLIGRIKVGWENGAWNEWFFVTDEGNKGWLAEAQGTYAISFETDSALPPVIAQELMGRLTAFQNGKQQDAKGAPLLGSHLSIQGKSLKIVDIKKTTCLGCEGELPFIAPQGQESTSIDLLGPQGEFASMEVSQGNVVTYVGNYIEWDEMHCTYLRSLEGWTWKP